MLAPGFSMLRCSPRLKALGRTILVAFMVEKLLCCHMGIINKGEQVMEAPISKFVNLFQGQVPPIAFEALHALFRLDCDLASVVEDAQLEHGGTDGLDHNAEIAVADDKI
ncbi:hypothetical protein D1007_23610 [Hordeum vulgare]|nr:hypothetical protein D1007_23610 [Hordeum vulgare]